MRFLALIYGIIFLGLGILGFYPQFAPHLDLLKTNDALNIIYIVTGAVALWGWLASRRGSRAFFQIFGLVYAIFAILGFVYNSDPILGKIASSQINTWFHVITAVIGLVVGFGSKGAS